MPHCVGHPGVFYCAMTDFRCITHLKAPRFACGNNSNNKRCDVTYLVPIFNFRVQR